VPAPSLRLLTLTAGNESWQARPAAPRSPTNDNNGPKSDSKLYIFAFDWPQNRFSKYDSWALWCRQGPNAEVLSQVDFGD